MAKWLFSSKGEPIAFISEDKVYTRRGDFVGRLEGTEVWHGSYKGEIYQADRLLYKSGKASAQRGVPGTPGRPGIPAVPAKPTAIAMPVGYCDVVL